MAVSWLMNTDLLPRVVAELVEALGEERGEVFSLNNIFNTDKH